MVAFALSANKYLLFYNLLAISMNCTLSIFAEVKYIVWVQVRYFSIFYVQKSTGSKRLKVSYVINFFIFIISPWSIYLSWKCNLFYSKIKVRLLRKVNLAFFRSQNHNKRALIQRHNVLFALLGFNVGSMTLGVCMCVWMCVWERESVGECVLVYEVRERHVYVKERI